MSLKTLYLLCFSQLARAAYVAFYYKDGIVKEVSQRIDWTMEDVNMCREIHDADQVKEIWFSILGNQSKIKDSNGQALDPPQEIQSVELFSSRDCTDYYLTPTLSNVVPYRYGTIERTGSAGNALGPEYKSFRFSVQHERGNHLTCH